CHQRAAIDETAGVAGPVGLTVGGSDVVSNTLSGADGGVILVDDQGPRVASVLVNGGTLVTGTPWFAQGSGNIDVQADITDVGSGVDAGSVLAQRVSDSK